MVKTRLTEALRIDIYARWRTSKPEHWPDLHAELRVVDRIENIVRDKARERAKSDG